MQIEAEHLAELAHGKVQIAGKVTHLHVRIGVNTGFLHVVPHPPDNLPALLFVNFHAPVFLGSGRHLRVLLLCLHFYQSAFYIGTLRQKRLGVLPVTRPKDVEHHGHYHQSKFKESQCGRMHRDVVGPLCARHSRKTHVKSMRAEQKAGQAQRLSFPYDLPLAFSVDTVFIETT